MHTVNTKPVQSPVVPDGPGTQYRRLYDYLAAGNTITFLIAMELKIDNLNKRIADLQNQGIKIYSRRVKIKNVQCKEYSLLEFNYHAL